MKDFFTFFLLPQKFALDLNILEEKYLNFQRQFHPDKAGIAEIENSINVNQGYKILKNPLTRAAHILQLNNVDVEKDGGNIRPDMATLEEILEIQEKIPNLNNLELLDLKKSINNNIKLLLADIELKLDNQDFANAAQLLIKAKYFDKILQDLRKQN